MGEMVVAASSQSSLLLLQPSRFGFRAVPAPTRSPHLKQSITVKYKRFFVSAADKDRAGVLSPELKAPPSTIVTNYVDLSTEGIDVEIEPDIGDGGNGLGDSGSNSGGGGGGGGGGGDESENEGDDSGKEEKKMGLSMSQKLTLGYAALVGIGGVMGYLKSGSQKSLLAGGLSASVLYYVHTQLPSNPVYASSIGLGVAAALMGVMGSRFLKSGKVFPAGVVSLVSLIMTGGYIHGIMRSAH